MTFESTAADLAFLGGRVVFASVLAFMAFGNLLRLEEMVGYADFKGAPLARVSVPLGSLALLAGAVAIAAGAFPLVGGLLVAGFLAAITPVMHDFWTMEGEEAQVEQFQFLKNVGLLGGALVFVALAGVEWPYAVGVAL